jgi:hypothetical protein
VTRANEVTAPVDTLAVPGTVPNAFGPVGQTVAAVTSALALVAWANAGNREIGG